MHLPLRVTEVLEQGGLEAVFLLLVEGRGMAAGEGEWESPRPDRKGSEETQDAFEESKKQDPLVGDLAAHLI